MMASNVQAAATLPALPLKNSVLFPHMLMPLVVGRVSSVAAVNAAAASEDKAMAVFAQDDPAVEDPKEGDLFRFGTRAVIKRMERGPEHLQLVVLGLERIELIRLEEEKPFLKAVIAPLAEPQDNGPEVEAQHRAVLELAAQIHELLQPQAQVGMAQMLSQAGSILSQVYMLAMLLDLSPEKEKAILSASTQLEALRLMQEYLTYELQVLQLRQKIASQAQTEITREQREYLLRQQLRAIQEELGDNSPEQAEVTELRRRMEEIQLPENVRKETEKELSRLERMPTASPDRQVSRSYVDLILELPWDKTTDDNLDLKRARQTLDEDHFDLKEVKERIIEHLAVMKLNPHAHAPILCFIGPPGVGKTSLGQSIARALGRKFERMSLGGMHDEAELRGHRRTYIGAMPGRILQAIRRADVRNPLLMLDEVDKLGQDFRGDPAAALLEILDPAQNHDFRDNYLDLPFDLSNVFFITTANTPDTIPRPLLDRMEVLRLSGYSDEEKVQIARRYLLPRRIAEAGLAAEQMPLADETLRYIIHRYTREAGVRELERSLGRIARKIATWVVEGNGPPAAVTAGQLFEILGPERFFAEKLRRQLKPGVATGLAWTESGGEVLYVEAVLLPEGAGLTLTGHLGEVMQESAKAAQSYIFSQAAELGIDQKRAERSGVHIHVPAGAIPKDGPSAGVTMATVLTSLYTGSPVRSDTAMTGEITLSGLILPVGGIKEKVLAAHRAEIRRVILPEDNEKDLRELPEHVRREMQFVLAQRVEDVLTAAIPELSNRLHPVGYASA